MLEAYVDWQPMETLKPYAGLRILGGWLGTELVTALKWASVPEYENGTALSWVDIDGEPGFTPTHWAHFPKPPQT